MWFIQMKSILDILNVFTEFGDLFDNIISSNLLCRALDSFFIYLFVDIIIWLSSFFSSFGEGFWSSSGLTTQYNSTSVSCGSSHLTSFAVLVDVSGSHAVFTTEELKALSVVTYIGLSISIVCLLLTVIFFLSFG